MVELSIILPVYNEQNAVRSTIEHVKKVMGRRSYEIIAVNDGSRDNSAQILKSIKGITVINNPYNLGYGASLKRGILASTGQWILITDADGTYPIQDIPKLLEHTDTYDMVVGSRTGKNVSIPLLRKPAKFIIGSLANILAGRYIPDVNSGFRVFKRELALRFFHLFPQRFSFTITITLAALTNEYTVKYVPVNYYSRVGSSSIHPVKDFIGFITLIVRMMTLFKPMLVFSLLSAFLALSAIAIFIYSLLVLDRILDVTIVIIIISALQIFIFGMLAEIVARERLKRQ